MASRKSLPAKPDPGQPAYYNENDPATAAWLRELIAADLIAPGDVDERSILEVTAADVQGYTQAHFFAGIGGWSYALRLAGWPDDRHVWTGSCPCQPFSSAGQGAGADDSRDLWPTWFQLLSECSPHVVFGEQVASADGLGWLDRLYVDLEGAGYAVGAVDLCAASVGAFHIRQRLWFVADAEESRPARRGQGAVLAKSGQSIGDVGDLADTNARGQRINWTAPSNSFTAGEPHTHEHGAIGGLADTARGDQRRHARDSRDEAGARRGEARPADGDAARSAGGLDDAGCSEWRPQADGADTGRQEAAGRQRLAGAVDWRDADWLPCRDGKARPVEPGAFPLAHGVPARVGRLRGYGNAIVPQVAATFIEAYLELAVEPQTRSPR